MQYHRPRCEDRRLMAMALAPAILMIGAIGVQAAVLTPLPALRGCATAIPAAATSPALGSARVTPATLTPQRTAARAASASEACAARDLQQMTDERTAALGVGWVAVVAMLVVIAGLVRVAFRARIGRSRMVARSTGMTARVGSTARPSDAERDRDVLIQACIEVSDRVPSTGLRDELLDALAEVGVTPVEAAPGDPFDSSRHRAAAGVATDDSTRDNVIVKTERAGYVDRGRRLRVPEVLVYKVKGGSRA